MTMLVPVALPAAVAVRAHPLPTHRQQSLPRAQSAYECCRGSPDCWPWRSHWRCLCESSCAASRIQRTAVTPTATAYSRASWSRWHDSRRTQSCQGVVWPQSARSRSACAGTDPCGTPQCPATSRPMSFADAGSCERPSRVGIVRGVSFFATRAQLVERSPKRGAKSRVIFALRLVAVCVRNAITGGKKNGRHAGFRCVSEVRCHLPLSP